MNNLNTQKTKNKRKTINYSSKNEEKYKINKFKLFPNILKSENKGNCKICNKLTYYYEESSIDYFFCKNCAKNLNNFKNLNTYYSKSNKSKINDYKHSTLKNLIFSYLTLKSDLNKTNINLEKEKISKLNKLKSEKRKIDDFILKLENKLKKFKKEYNDKFKNINKKLNNFFINNSNVINKLNFEFNNFENDIIINYKNIIKKLDIDIFLKIYEDKNLFLLKTQEKLINHNNSFTQKLYELDNEINIKNINKLEIGSFLNKINMNSIEYSIIKDNKFKKIDESQLNKKWSDINLKDKIIKSDLNKLF